MSASQNRWLILFALLLGAGWIWLSRTPPGSTTNGGIPAPQRGFLAPDFSLQDEKGETYRLADLRGRPLLVNFWASWCGPCRAEMPALEKVSQRYREQGFLVLGVNATNQDDAKAASAFAQQLGLSFPILFDQDGSASRLYQVRSLPSSFLIDADGVIQDVIIGGPMSEALLEIRAQQILEESR